MALRSVLAAWPTSPLKMMDELDKAFHKEWLSMEFDHLLPFLEEACKKEPIDGRNLDLIRALRGCNHSNAPWTRFEVFSAIVQAVHGIPVRFDTLVTLEPFEVATTAELMNQLRTEPWSEELKKFHAASLLAHGLHFVPFASLLHSREYIAPYVEDAEALFTSLKHKPLEDVELPESMIGIQVMRGLSQWDHHQQVWKGWK